MRSPEASHGALLLCAMAACVPQPQECPQSIAATNPRTLASSNAPARAAPQVASPSASTATPRDPTASSIDSGATDLEQLLSEIRWHEERARDPNRLFAAYPQPKLKGFRGIPSARPGPFPGVAVASVMGTLFTDATWLRHAVGLEMRSLPFRTEPRSVVNVPLRVASARGEVRTQTFCIPRLRNSDTLEDATEDCSVLRTYVVQPGDTLQGVAQLAYGNPERWRGLASINGLSSPDLLVPGMTLVLP